MQTLIDALKGGSPVLIATDTVFGVAALPASAGAATIFELKQRPADSALPWLVGSRDALDEYGSEVPGYARCLAELFWPGALTLVVKASPEAVALGGIAEDGTVALRMPDDAACLSLIEAVGCPLACTSANIHGEPAPLRLDDVASALRSLPASADMPRECPGAIASTIVDCTGQLPSILREGAISSQTVLAAALLDDRLH